MRSAVVADADLIGASVLSGSHIELAEQITDGLRAAGADDRISVVMGGIIPKGDVDKLTDLGVKRVFTPADYELIDIMESITDVIESAAR